MSFYTLDLSVVDSDKYDKNYIKVSSDMTNYDLMPEVEKLARYFWEEFNYMFVHKPKHPFNAILLTRTEDDDTNDSIIFGCCVFEKKEKYVEKPWVLEWVWIHPFFRNRGNLKKYWGLFEKEFGDFFIKRPISPAMQVFLKSVPSKYTHEEYGV